MAQVRAARGDYDAAMRLLEQAAALYRHGFYPDVRPIAAMKARVQISAGDLTSAATWAEERGLGVDDDPDYLREYEHLTLARLLLAQHGPDAAPRRRGDLPLGSVHGLLDRLHAARPPTGGATAACWRSGCCRPSPTAPAATWPRRSPSWARR